VQQSVGTIAQCLLGHPAAPLRKTERQNDGPDRQRDQEFEKRYANEPGHFKVKDRREWRGV
jgi:hypothetical protein